MKKNDLFKAVFGEDFKPETYKFVPHHFDEKIREGGKQYCLNCGLIALNNPYSDWAVNMGCKHALHPDNKRMRKKTSPM